MNNASLIPAFEDSRTFWTNRQKIGFRLIFLFFLLFIIIQNNGVFPFWDFLTTYLHRALHVIIPWVGKNILHLPYDITIFTNGSGDTTYDNVLVLFLFSLSVVGAVIWTLAERQRENYNTLFYWLTVAVRFYVGLTLINYGLVKVIKLQFPSPQLFRLTELYGDSSPMGLAWTFFGFSTGYNLFIGSIEIAAVLLLFRKTTTLGAFITLGTTANIMAVNYFYDVPVKMLSTALFVMTVFLIARDAGRLFRLFVKNETVKLELVARPAFGKRWIRITLVSFKYLVIGYTFLYVGYNCLQSLKARAVIPPLYGLYEVQDFIVSNDTMPPLTTDKARWRQMSIERAGSARVVHMTDSVSRFITKIDTVLKTMDLTLRSDTTHKYHFKYENHDKSHFVMNGMIEKTSVVISFNRYTDFKDRFLLTNRGFHWINETPFNQ